MSLKTLALLVLASVVNAGIGVFAYLFSVFATHPAMQDVTLRIGYYVLHAIVVVALVATVAPWILVLKTYNKSALLTALLPALMLLLAVLAFLLLDSWLQRNFAS